ncbi:MAG: UDP-N-acetylmuramate dehydrogenase, partial [Treponema sp.]|nr:UDP-N-acetylmuramate dehydrogenase [Treponema sp.]
MRLRSFIARLNAAAAFRGETRFAEPMAPHTTLRVGGPADLYVRPDKSCFAAYAPALLKAAAAKRIPVFILGGGANIAVADKGIRGIVLDTGACTGRVQEGGRLRFWAGTTMDEAAEEAAGRGLGGLEFLAGMPGTLGGGLWMNARCYGQEFADRAAEADIIDERFERVSVPLARSDFSYKKSPFQERRCLILTITFRLKRRPIEDIRAEMAACRLDREQKGQFRFPSAGSAFKNNPAFGEPTGRIIEALGLRGLQIGGAQIAPWHGNLLINTGNALAADVKALIEKTAAEVKAARGIDLESEILF